MAYLSKEEYERRERAAERRMYYNSLVGALNEAQHHTLAWLCKIRHSMHSGNTAEALYNVESAEHDTCWSYIDGDVIKEELEAVSLPEWEWSVDITQYDTSFDSELDDEGYDLEFDSDDEREQHIQEHYEYWYGALYDLIEQWNKSVELYLREIDRIYGTNYCPTGSLRQLG